MDTKINYRAILGLDISKPLKEIEKKYNDLEEENEKLREENEYLKSERYKDSELALMQEQCRKMRVDLYRGFPISEKEKSKIDNWFLAHIRENQDTRHCCNRYEFESTEIGDCGTVKCVCGAEFTFKSAE